MSKETTPNATPLQKLHRRMKEEPILLERAARKLCELRGLDANGEYFDATRRIMHQRAWYAMAQEITEHMTAQLALESIS